MYKNFLLYGHGGAYNHGSEAIIRCTVDLIKKKYPQSKIILSTHFKDCFWQVFFVAFRKYIFIAPRFPVLTIYS